MTTPNSVRYIEKKVSGHSPDFPGFRARSSNRWFRHWQSVRMPIPVPYIDRFGKFTIHRLGVWFTNPESWYASVTSTIDSRLLSLYRSRHNGWFKLTIAERNLITRISALYAFNHNNYFMDRILANLRPGRLGIAKSIFNSFRSRMGETFRFVYSQTITQVSWLNFRSKWIRDKPSSEIISNARRFTFVRQGAKDKIKFYGRNPFLDSLNFIKVNRLEITRLGTFYLEP